MRMKFALPLAALLGLVACGDTLGEQALVGAGVGAGTAALLDGDVVTGALVGGAGNVLFCQNNPNQCDDAGLPL